MRYRKNIDNIGYIDIYGKKKTQFTCHFVIVHAQKAYAHVNKKNKRKKSQSAGIWEDQLHWTGLFGRVICYDVCDFWSSWSGARLSTTSMIVGWEDFSVTVTGSDSVGLLGEEARFFVLFKVVYTIRWLDFKCHIKFVVFLALVFTFFLLSRHVWSSLVRNSAHSTVFTSPF